MSDVIKSQVFGALRAPAGPMVNGKCICREIKRLAFFFCKFETLLALQEKSSLRDGFTKPRVFEVLEM